MTELNGDQTAQNTQQEDIVSRVYKATNDVPVVDNNDNADGIRFDPKMIDAITDPKTKALLESAYKSMQGDYTRKTQELAKQRKEVEDKINRPMTVEEVRQLVKRSDFIQSAQIVAQELQPNLSGGELTDTEWSALNDVEKKELLQLREMTLSNNNQLNSMRLQEEERTIKEKYGSYNQENVNRLYNGLINGSVQATREHLHKVVDYDDAIRRAYKMGREEVSAGISEKRSAINNINGINITPTDELPEKEAKESNMSYFKRLAHRNIEKMKQSGNLTRR